MYSDDPSASQSFADFKADEDTEHLKLLFCIDALNEGIHVENVSGVILLRPTVSPIIYKQQIGRALAAGKRVNAVIFDVVLNIENLYSIGAVEEEMQIAMTYYRSLGEDDAIINERFQVIDEVRDCIALFEKLNDTRTAIPSDIGFSRKSVSAPVIRPVSSLRNESQSWIRSAWSGAATVTSRGNGILKLQRNTTIPSVI